jgi:WD40 repeat protein
LSIIRCGQQILESSVVDTHVLKLSKKVSSMHLHRGSLRFVLLGMLAAYGCGTKPSVDSPPTAASAVAEDSTVDAAPLAEQPSAAAESTAAAPAKDTDSPRPAAGKSSANKAAKPAAPSPEQIAKWGVAAFEPLQMLACRDGFADPAVFCLAISPDGKQFVTGGAKLTVWNTTAPQPAAEMLAQYKHDEVERPIGAAAISANGNWLAAGDQKGMVRIWTLSDQRELLSFKAHNGHVTKLAFSPDSRLLATTSYSGEVNLWQLPAGTKLKSLKMGEQEIKRLEFLSDNLLAAAGSEATIWNVESGSKEKSLTAKYVRQPALGLSSDRQLLGFNDPDGAVQFWDVSSSKPTGQTLRGAGAHLIAFSHDGKWIATYSQDSIIRIWDAATGSVVQVIDADGGRTSALQWLPDANALVIASEQGRVRLWGTLQSAQAIGLESIPLAALESPVGNAHKSLTSAQLKRVIDIRSFPRLPGAVPQWSDFGTCSYTAHATQKEAERFYRYYLGQAGWAQATQPSLSQPGLVFRKDGCELNLSFAPAAVGGSGRDGDLQISLQFAGNYDVRWLPRIAPIDSKSSWGSFSSVSYRTKASLTDVEVALLKQFHDAGWTAYTRLAASSHEEPKSRSISLLQGGSVLTVTIGYPADSTQELFVQTSLGVTNKSLPIPPDSGWIEFDNSTDLQLVANTKIDLQQTTEFFDKQMAAQGWLAREAGRQFKDDKGWLPYCRGQQDVLLRLTELPAGGTRIVVGDAASSSWQLQKPAGADKKTDKPGVQAADFALPAGANEVKFEVDQKQIEFEVLGATPAQLGEQFATQMESLDWKRESAGVTSDEYVFITFSKERAEIQLRARSAGKKATAMISGDGLLWDKPLLTVPVRISYGPGSAASARTPRWISWMSSPPRCTRFRPAVKTSSICPPDDGC